MAANLCHKKHVMAAAHERFPHDLLAQAVMIFPGVVHKSNALVVRCLHDLDGFTLRFNQAQIVAAERQRRYFHPGASERAPRYLAVDLLRHDFPFCLLMNGSAEINSEALDYAKINLDTEGQMAIMRGGRLKSLRKFA